MKNECLVYAGVECDGCKGHTKNCQPIDTEPTPKQWAMYDRYLDSKGEDDYIPSVRNDEE